MKPTTRRQRGLTLIESAVAACIAALSVGAVAPKLSQMTERRHVDGAAAQLETDLQYLRSLAVSRNQSMRMSFTDSAGAQCYVIHSGAAGDCRCDAGGAAVCVHDAQAFRAVAFQAGAPVAVRSNSASILVSGARGTVSPTATMRVTGRAGSELHVVVNIMGRVRDCAATVGLPGHPHC